jgi:hypothetical protein
MKFKIELSESEAFILLNSILGFTESLVTHFKGDAVEKWMVDSVKLTKRVYHVLTESYPSLKKEPAIKQWWDDFCRITNRPYNEEYDKFIEEYQS